LEESKTARRVVIEDDILMAPASLQHALRTAKQRADWHGELPTQAALARFIDGAGYRRGCASRSGVGSRRGRSAPLLP
jgi:hypothetical protein